VDFLSFSMVLLPRQQDWSRSASDLGDHLAGFTHRRRDMPRRISHPQVSRLESVADQGLIECQGRASMPGNLER
jgi:hypothetical protein